MAITETTTLLLDGEQPALFAALEREESEAIERAQAPFREKRGNMVSVLLAGKGLLGAVQSTPGLNINVGATVITLTPPDVERTLTLEQSAAD